MQVVRTESLTKTYGDSKQPVHALQQVNLIVEQGEFLAVMGPSGSGKSTLLYMVGALDRPTSGKVWLNDKDLSTLNDDALTILRRAHLGFVFQAFHVLPYLTVSQNVALPLSLLGKVGTEAENRVAVMLAAVGLGERGDSVPSELSGGELQRVAIARALVHAPRLVLADEPTGNLDPESAGQVLSLLREQIKTNNAAGILVTHSQVAARTCDRILQLTATGLREIAPQP